MKVEFVYRKHAGKMSICGFKVNGIFKTTKEWAFENNISYNLLYGRITKGMDDTERLFAEPGTIVGKRQKISRLHKKLRNKRRTTPAIVNGYKILI